MPPEAADAADAPDAPDADERRKVDGPRAGAAVGARVAARSIRHRSISHPPRSRPAQAGFTRTPAAGNIFVCEMKARTFADFR
ncbi:hypothetical protein WJ27_00825 [Burkholderia thailandensis]|nr:hypothetical protein WJ27_00825 [Burkholderia thailandensis]